tara:strand:+ start:285 stop:761 length:477 start_codon:yes stop_codon:yes gene_type:complete
MRYALVLVSTALIFFCFIFFWPSNENNIISMERQSISPETSEKSQNETLASEEINRNDEERYEAMKYEYKILEKERRILKQRLARLKHNMWGLKFEKNKAKEMSEILLNAHKFIKNPRMLGAFSDVDSIKDEIMKLRFSNKSLDRVKEIINQTKNNNN